MKNSAQWIDEVKQKKQLPSDYAVSKTLGVTQSCISHYRNGKSAIDFSVANKVAELTGHDPAEVVLSAQVERAKTEEEKVFWSSLLERLKLGSGALAALLLVSGVDLDRYSNLCVNLNNNNYSIQIKSNGNND